MKKYESLTAKEAQNYKLRAAFNWLRDAEGCNKLFFQTTRMRDKTNEMPHIRKPNGQVTTSLEEKLGEVANAYAATFTKRRPDSESLSKVVRALRETERGLSDAENLELQNLLDLGLRDIENPDREPAKCWVCKTIEK